MRTGEGYVTEQSTGNNGNRQLSSQELEFLQHWRPLIQRLGEQKQVAETMAWSTSTVSRDYSGKTLPNDERLRELCNYLRLPEDQRFELAVLLRRARDVRQSRKTTSLDQDPPVTVQANAAIQAEAPVQGVALVPAQWEAISRQKATSVGRRGGLHAKSHPRAAWISGAVAVVVVAVAATFALYSRATAQDGVRGSYPGEGLKTVAISTSSLIPSLTVAFRQGRTAGAASVTGFEFRIAKDESLCLTAGDTGPSAGHNGDQVEVTACKLTANQIWIPEQWEINGAAFTRLVSDKYQSMCLNADNIGGLENGRRVQLWNCYPANNESWDFGDWYRNVQPGQHSYPILLHTDRLSLDADKYDFRDGDTVNIWTQYAAANQFWS